jgi:hypothetical protein
MFTNWKTTSAGILAIVGALTGFVFVIINKQLTPETITTFTSALLIGIGLLFAKDGNVTGGDKDNGLRPK